MKTYKGNIVMSLLIGVFLGTIFIGVGLVAWRVLEYTFTTGDLIVLLFIVVFFMSLKYN